MREVALATSYGNLLDASKSATLTTDSRDSLNMGSTVTTYTGATLMPSSIGLAIPGYREFPANSFVLLRQFAKGGGGQIYLAQAMTPETSLYGKELVVKLFGNSQEELSSKLLGTVKQEISILQLMSKNCHFPKFIGYCDKPVAILMKYYECGSLEAYLKKPLGRSHKISITSDIAQALFALHSCHIAHCDLKPANILLDLDKNGGIIAVLTDFGIARITSDEILAAKDFNIVNLRGLSRHYAAPEVFHRFRGAVTNYTASVINSGDIYAFSIIICELLNGKKSWQK